MIRRRSTALELDDLVLSPPVTTPAEPPSGAFLLTATLRARGRRAALLDLSLELFYRLLEDERLPARRPAAAAVRYLLDAEDGYSPHEHRSATGSIHRLLRGLGSLYPGWRMTLMDLEAPVRVHDPLALARRLSEDSGPLAGLWTEALDPVLEATRPSRALISLAYLSQLAAAIDLARHLERRGVETIVGGSLVRSLALTGHGLDELSRALPGLSTDDGSQLTGEPPLERLAWPLLLGDRPYLGARPVVPLALSTGCHWRRCLFCPDRALPFRPLSLSALSGLLSSMPASVRERGPVCHLLDSALPPGRLAAFLPLAREHGVSFYGFARPTRELTRGGLLEAAADSGCAMLQLGVESGSRDLLARFDKGIDPAEARQVLRVASAAGIRTYVYLLFGLPGESEADREATLELVRESEGEGEIDFLNTSLFNLPRDCELTRRAGELGLEIEKFPGDDAILRLYRPFVVDGLRPRDQARAFLRRRFDPDPSVRAARLRTPRWLRAAHLAMMRLPGRRGPA
ncbi:MAG: radical SAM protein [Polyangia bacterium]